MLIITGALMVLVFLLGLFIGWFFQQDELKKLRLAIFEERRKNNKLNQLLIEQEKEEKQFTTAHESILTFLHDTEESIRKLRKYYNSLREEKQLTNVLMNNPRKKRLSKIDIGTQPKTDQNNKGMTMINGGDAIRKTRRKKVDQDNKIATIKIAVVSGTANQADNLSENEPTIKDLPPQ